MKKQLLSSILAFAAGAALAGVPVGFELPKGGLYQVSVAVVEKAHPERIVSTFVAGEVFDTTVSNRFVVSWDGLDENFMPCPPGEYAVKGIYAPAHVWPVDGEAHAITARWVGGPGAFLPKIDEPEVEKKHLPFFGDPVNSPLLDVDTTPDGKAVLGFQYLENGRSCPLLDLSKPKGQAQFIAAFPSGGAGGGPCATTDGTDVWACSHDGAPWFIYRPDMKNFGPDNAPYRRGGYLPKGRVWDMASAKFGDKSFVYVVERGTLEKYRASWGGDWWRESETERTDVVTVMTGADGKILAKVPVAQKPTAIKVAGDTLYVLYRPDGARLAIGAMKITDGVPGGLRKVFDVPAEIECEDFARDTKGRFFFPDPAKNRLFRTDANGKVTGTAGRLAKQVSGSYDAESMMAPRRLSAWKDAQGVDRILVVEHDGPNRISEWNAETMAYMGEYPNFQLKANCGYAVDPAHPEMVYIPGHNDWLSRFKVDYATGEWKLDAVFEGVPDDAKSGLAKMKCFRVKGRLYFVSVLSGAVFRLTDDGKGVVRAGSAKDLQGAPAGAFTYHGQNFLEDLSYLAIAMGTKDVWRAVPSIADNGDVTFTRWEKVLSDPVFEAIASGKATALWGGNELADNFSSDWMQADGTIGGDMYVHASGGPNYSANFRPQHKITRYRRNGKGGYDLVWRVGRTQLPGGAKVRGQIAGGMRMFKPINGILAVIDQSRSGVFLYTEDGIYVDTLFAGDAGDGVYVQPGEFFVGSVFANKDNNKIYYGSGKYTPFVYELEGWDMKRNPIKSLPIAKKTRTVVLTASATADPPREALRIRKALGTDLVAEFSPRANGWDGANPVEFSDGGDKVEVRCLYTPEALAFRWHVRKDTPVVPTVLQQPERLFNHDQAADTVSVYFQGDPDAPAGGAAEGRPGDVRFTCGLFDDGKGGVKPVLVGFYPEWKGADAKPQTYRTVAGGRASYAHVGIVKGAKIAGALDEDKKGFVIEAAIPRSAVPVARPFSGGFRTRVNFDANLGGHHRFWWSNTDGSASRETYDEPTESRFFPGSWSLCKFAGLGDGLVMRAWATIGPFGGPGFERFTYDPSNKDEVRRACEAAKYGPDAEAPRADAEYKGETINGWWDKKESLKWERQPISVDGVRIKMGLGSQVWFATTAVWSPADANVDLDLYSHFMAYVTWKLNGEKIDVPVQLKEDNPTYARTKVTKSVQLKKGWNVIEARGFCLGCPPFHIGACVRADEALLWKLKTSVFAK